jgi:hypothetical protein
MKCPLCETEPDVRDGTPIKDGDNVYWLHVFRCHDERCPNFDKDIGEVRTDIFDNSKQIEAIY